MNNEIKEILNYLKDDTKSFIICGVSYYKISDYKTKVLLDYITNLQNENSRLKNNNQAMQEEMTKTWEKYDNLQKEINKLTAESTDWESKYYEMQDNFHVSNEEIKRLNNIIDELEKRI